MIATKYNSVTLPDTEIVQKILAGEQLFFELLIRRHNPVLYKVGRSYGFTHEDTEDVIQEAHVAAYLNLAKFENRAQYKTWLVKIMINKCLYKVSTAGYKHLQKDTQPVTENMKAMPDTSNIYNTEKNILNGELAQILEQSIEQIPVDYRMVFVLREKEGMSIAETAEVLDISQTNVKVRLNRAKAMLRHKLENYYNIASVYEFNLIYCDKIVERVFKQIQQLG